MSRVGSFQEGAGPRGIVSQGAKAWLGRWSEGWNQFWFAPRHSHVLAGIRIATGAMLFYTHCVIALDLASFLGSDAWITPALARELHDGTYGMASGAWSYLWFLSSPAFLWWHQAFALLVTLLMTIGLGTRVVVPLAWWMQLMFMHRLTGALFGLDQVTTLLVTYLMLAPCGSRWSIDAWLRRRLDQQHETPAGQLLQEPRQGPRRRWLVSFFLPAAEPSTATTVATRLIQIHLCVIYLFGGLWKGRGEMWWDGTAMWFAAANHEYRSLDLTWLADYPLVFATLAHATLFWEIFYPALVWPRLTRPLVLGMAVLVHAGIAIFLGMITFGVIMIVANSAFVEPSLLTPQTCSADRRSPGPSASSTSPRNARGRR